MAITTPDHPNARLYTDPTGASFLAIVTDEHRTQKGVLVRVTLAYYDNRGGTRRNGGTRGTQYVVVPVSMVSPTGQNLTMDEWCRAHKLGKYSADND
jgi:hypothetical protein